MIGTFWFQLNSIKAGASCPKGAPTSQVKKLPFWVPHDGIRHRLRIRNQGDRSSPEGRESY